MKTASPVTIVWIIGAVALAYLCARTMPDRGETSTPFSRAHEDDQEYTHLPSPAGRSSTEARGEPPGGVPALPGATVAATSSIGDDLPEPLIIQAVLTVADLRDITVDLWAQDDFLATKLSDVGIDVPGYDLSGDGLFLERLGWLPTDADCEAAMQSTAVLQALQGVTEADLELDALQWTPRERMTAGGKRRLEDLRVIRRRLMLDLARSLDRESPYHNWEVIARAFEKWSGEQ